MISKITDKFQTTVPKKIREKLKLIEHDAIDWEIEGDQVIVHHVKRPFLQYQGAIKVGKGDIQKDIKAAGKIAAKKI